MQVWKKAEILKISQDLLRTAVLLLHVFNHIINIRSIFVQTST